VLLLLCYHKPFSCCVEHTVFLIIAVFSSMPIPVVILTGIQISIPGLYLLTNMLIKIWRKIVSCSETVKKNAYIITIVSTAICCPIILSVCCWFQLNNISICRHYGNFCGLFHPLLLRKCHPTLQALKSCQWRMSRPELGLGCLNYSHRLIILYWYHVIISSIDFFEFWFWAGCVSFLL